MLLIFVCALETYNCVLFLTINMLLIFVCALKTTFFFNNYAADFCMCMPLKLIIVYFFNNKYAANFCVLLTITINDIFYITASLSNNMSFQHIHMCQDTFNNESICQKRCTCNYFLINLIFVL